MKRLIANQIFKGIVKRAKPWKCNIRLVSRILWHNRIIPSLKEWWFWYLTLIGDFPPIFLLTRLCSNISVKGAYFHWKNLWRRVLEANEKQVPPKSYFLKIRIDSVNQILKNKGKVWICWCGHIISIKIKLREFSC